MAAAGFASPPHFDRPQPGRGSRRMADLDSSPSATINLVPDWGWGWRSIWWRGVISTCRGVSIFVQVRLCHCSFPFFCFVSHARFACSAVFLSYHLNCIVCTFLVFFYPLSTYLCLSHLALLVDFSAGPRSRFLCICVFTCLQFVYIVMAYMSFSHLIMRYRSWLASSVLGRHRPTCS